MAGKRGPYKSRVVTARAALDEVNAAFADGVFDIARAIVRVAENDAPDAPPYGEGLVQRGGAAVWVNGKKTHEMTTGPSGKVDRPRALRVRSQPRYVVGAAGFGFPAMFLEFGTVKMHARPFFTKAADEVIGSQAQILLSAAMQRRLRGERDPKSAEISARIKASRAKKQARRDEQAAAKSAALAKRMGLTPP